MLNQINRPVERWGPFAVTGHIKLDPGLLNDLQITLQNVFSCIASASSQCPPTLISGLAEGADTLAAEAAIKAGWYVDAVLALPLEALTQDYSIAGRKRLFKILKSCRNITIVSENIVPRPECYVRQSRHLLQMSSSLIAIWDGLPSDLPGGTAYTVSKFMDNREAKPVCCNEPWGSEFGDVLDQFRPGVKFFRIDQECMLIHISARRE